MLAEDAEYGRVDDKILQARRPVHREVDLLHKNHLMVVVPVMQNGVEGTRLHILAHQEELGLSKDPGLAIVRQFESMAEILERFRVVSKDQQEIGAVFDQLANLSEPISNVRVNSSQLSMSEK